MKRIACSPFHAVPVEASPARDRSDAFAMRCARRPRASGGHAPRSGAARLRAGRGALLAAAFATASCTVTSEDFAPTSLDDERDPSASGADPGAAGDRANSSVPTPLSGLSPVVEAGEELPTAAPLAEGSPANVSGGTAPSSEDDAPSDDGPLVPEITPDAGSAQEQPIESEPPVNEPPVVLPELSPLVGWAGLPGLGLETTTGGGATAPVVARTAAELVELAARPDPLTIALVGTIAVPALTLASNKTLVGIGSGATLLGGISIRGTVDAFVENVIVANLNVVAATSTVDGDGIQVHYAHHVWVDHCALSDAADGLLDIVHGSDFVTVSHSRFFYTDAAPDPQHRFAALIGHDIANSAEDLDRLNVTWHHDVWGEGVTRALSGRFGNIHVFNSLFRSPLGDTALSAGFASSWLVENNQFEDVAAPHTILTGSGASLAATGNVYLRSAGARDFTATGFVPAYAYDLESPIELIRNVEAEAGPR